MWPPLSRNVAPYYGPKFGKNHYLRNIHLLANIEISAFNQAVEQFARNAINKKEINGMEPELFWSLAFGPLDALIKFHLEKENVYTHEMFEITKENLKSLFEMIVTGFQRKK